MEAIYGLALMSASILALFFAAKIRNAPSASEWVKSGAVLQTVLFSTVVGFIFGLSMIFQYGVNFSTTGFGSIEAGLLVAIVVVSGACWRAIKKMPTTQEAVFTGTTDDLPLAANNHGPQLRTGHKSGRSSHKVA